MPHKFVTEGRKLVTFRKIANLFPIEGADAIEAAQVDGWIVVVKKGEFEIGDDCLFFEIDSLLPLDNPIFTFLNKGKTYTVGGGQYARLRTIKLRGQISQGLALPLEHFDAGFYPQITHEYLNSTDLVESISHYGIEDYLGVKKYEPADTTVQHTDAAGAFPRFMPKTDEERLQNVYSKYAEAYEEVEFEASMKLEGSSISIAYIHNEDYLMDKLDNTDYPYNYQDGQVIVCSRNMALKYNPDSVFWKGAEALDMPAKIKSYCEDSGRQLDFQGELMGPKIQGNIEKFEDYRVYVYRIWDIDKQCELSPYETDVICQRLGCLQVPRLFVGKVFKMFQTLQDFLAASEIPSINAKQAEGLVYKSIENVNGKQIHFKVINNKYLLKQE